MADKNVCPTKAKGAMPTLLALFALSLGLSVILTPLIRSLAGRWGLIDKPDQRRKLHAHDIPVAGGIAVLLASPEPFGIYTCLILSAARE